MEKQDFDHNSTEINEQKPSVEIMQAEIIRRICFREYPPGSQLKEAKLAMEFGVCLLYTSPSPRDRTRSRMPSSA